ncbi:MAG: RNA ligase family protein, partial [Planctomycetes bacterium]|nr:RNA ligase family protein [Planctomycetota bacterium]
IFHRVLFRAVAFDQRHLLTGVDLPAEDTPDADATDVAARIERGHEHLERRLFVASRFGDASDDLLEDRFIMYGEWMYAKHTVSYDALPHYFMEFDVYDKKRQVFLGTGHRHLMFHGKPIVSVVVVADFVVDEKTTQKDFSDLIGPSQFKTQQWRDRLEAIAKIKGQDPKRVYQETDPSDLSEGIYIKVEDLKPGVVTDRLKWVRGDFVQAIEESGTHWKSRPIIPNQLRPGIDIFTS